MLRRLPTALLLASLVAFPALAGHHEECTNDGFSRKVGILLGLVEGSDFPALANAEGWRQRRSEIHVQFAAILNLTNGDTARREAAFDAVVAAESLAAPEREAHMLGTGLERGEVRAWVRRALRGYPITEADERFVDPELITELLEAWDDQEASHVERSLPLYQEKAAALREIGAAGECS